MPDSSSDPRTPEGDPSVTNDRHGTRGPGEPLSVLLLEDTESVADRFEDCLRAGPTEATLRRAETLEAGLGALRQAQPDVLVVGLEWSDGERPEAVKALVSAVPEVPIVALVESGELGLARAAHRAGVTEHLQKRDLSPALVGRTLR